MSLRPSVPQWFFRSFAKERVGSNSRRQIEEQRLEKPQRDPKLFSHFIFFITPAAVCAWFGIISPLQKKERKYAMNYPLSTDMNVVQWLVAVY